MPVKDQPVGPTFTRLGTIALGYQEPVLKKDGTPKLDKRGKPIMRPVATDYFVLDRVPQLLQWYDEQPTELNVMWPFNDVDSNLDDYYRLYSAGSIKCRGDGEVVDICVKDADFVVTSGVCIKPFRENDHDFKPGDIVPCKGPGKKGLYPKCAECSIKSYPKVIVVEDWQAGHFGYYQIGSGSTSKHGRANIRGALEAVRELVRFLTGRPHLANIPMILSLKPQSISVPLKDSKTGRQYRARMEKPILQLVPHPDWLRVQTSAMLEQAYQPLTRLPIPAAQLQAPEQSTPEPLDDQQPTIPEESFEEGEFRDAQRLDVSGIETPGQCWTKVLEVLQLNKSDAVKLAKLTKEDLATLHPADVYAKVWMAVQAKNATRSEDQQPSSTAPAEQSQRGAASPTTVKAELQAASKKLRNATPGQRGLITKLLNLALGGDEARHSVLFWIWGKESQSDLTDSQIAAMWGRLKPDKTEGTWLADPVAIAEFQAIHKQALLDAGQLEMKLAEPEAPVQHEEEEIPW
jgi:hypothetical protein